MGTKTSRKPAHLAQTRERLVAQRARFEGQGARIGRHLREGLPADSEDQAQALVNDEVMNALDQNGRAELEKIEAAIGRLDDGSYGTCAVCGAWIDERRLEVLPTTEHCRACAGQ